jgi:hypothetical protein
MLDLKFALGASPEPLGSPRSLSDRRPGVGANTAISASFTESSCAPPFGPECVTLVGDRP